jgi:protein-S-isoprenylcysteine O-methyltransferase Ste14
MLNMMSKNRETWWRGSRGEWYVVGQVVLMVLVFFGPRHYPGWSLRPFPLPTVCTISGAGFLLFGTVLLVSGLLRLGANLTPLPYPKDNAKFIESGPYRFVRHPMYSGGAVIAFGWALFVQSWFTLLYALILAVFLDIKSRQEERWLVLKFPGYGEYQRRVRKLIPFIY